MANYSEGYTLLTNLLFNTKSTFIGSNNPICIYGKEPILHIKIGSVGKTTAQFQWPLKEETG